MKQRDLVMREKKNRHIFPPTLESHVDFMLLSAQWKCFCPNSPWSERGGRRLETGRCARNRKCFICSNRNDEFVIDAAILCRWGRNNKLAHFVSGRKFESMESSRAKLRKHMNKKALFQKAQFSDNVWCASQVSSSFESYRHVIRGDPHQSFCFGSFLTAPMWK